ncbi:hypothetical protein RQP46_007039 [Phenoliferia psychrophenolica]
MSAASRLVKKAATVDDDLLANGLSRYHLEPPSWRAPWLANKPNSGYPQFYPTCAGQDEDQLTDSAVKIGFTGKSIVKTESFSAHQLIYEKLKGLKGDTILPELSRLATAVAERARARNPSYGPPAFRLPSRVSANDSKRAAWFNDLANQAIPLSKLSRNIPHGYVGEKRLEMLFDRQVPLLRAVWYIRAIGAIEIQAAKSRAGFSIANYTREWSAIVHEFVRKQLAEIAYPDGAVAALAPPPEPRSLASSASSSSVAAGKAPARRILADNDLRQAWTARFSYTLQILEALYEEHLVDRDSFLRFIIQQAETSHIGQLPFVLFLAEEYTAEFLLSEPLSARLVSACLDRLKDIPADATSAVLDETAHALRSLIRSFFISLPDAFVASPLWTAHSKQLEGILLTPDLEPTLAETIKADLADLSARAEASSEGTYDADSLEPDELEMIQILDDIAFPSDLSAVHKSLFHKRRRRLPLAAELSLLFTWATTSDRTGAHRPYAVAALVAMERDHVAGRSKLDAEAAFIGWIDRGLAPWDSAAVAGLLAELVRVGVVSYSLYLQRMIARGETEQGHETPSLHLQLLRTVALYGEAGNPLAKRRIALRAGASARADSKRLVDAAEREFDKLVPLVPGDTEMSGERDCTALLEALEALAKDGSHLGITRQLIPQRLATASERPLSLEDHAIFVKSFVAVQDFWGLLQYIIIVLRSLPPRNLLLQVLDIVEVYLDLWTSMGELGNVAGALLAAHEGLKVVGISERRAVLLLRQLGNAGHLDAASLALIEQDFQGFASSLPILQILPQALPAGPHELPSLAVDASPQAVAAQLAATLSGLTIWRLADSKVEVQSCLERLDLDTSLQDGEKAEAFNSLSRQFLDRVCSGAGHTYLGEQVARCFHGRASDELVSVAFSRLAEAVDGLAESASPERRTTSLTTLRCTGRLLNTLLQSSKACSRPEPLNLLLTAIKSCLDGLLDSDNTPEKESVLHATHLLGVALRCTPANPPAETCELFKDCLIPCAKLAATLSKDCSQESELAALLLDTCSHLLFTITTIAPSLRLPSFHAFLSSEIDIDTLPNSIVQRLFRLFGFYSAVVPLANPWEMVDHADPGPLKETRHNIGPIDLAYFDARIIEAIPAVTALDTIPQSPATSSGHSERGLQTNFDFETPCTGLSVAARDHRRTLGGIGSKPAPSVNVRDRRCGGGSSSSGSRWQEEGTPRSGHFE